MQLNRRITLLALVAVGTCGADTCSPVYDVSTSQMRTAMRATSYGKQSFASWCDEYDEFHVRASGLDPRYCHTQGIAVGTEKVAVTCQGLSGAKHGRGGWVQHFDKRTLKASGSAEIMRWHPYDHPVAGNGIVATGQIAGRNVRRELYPIVEASTSGQTKARVHFRDAASNKRTCEFYHSLGDKKASPLGAVSAVSINNQTYLAACGWSCNNFHIYRIDHPEHGDCGATRLQTITPRRSGDSRLFDDGAGDDNWGHYNGLALVLNDDNQVFMIGTHEDSDSGQGFMDTWEVKNLTATSDLQLHKLAKFRWGGSWNGQTYFKQGLATEFIDNNRLAIWLSPHDVRDNGNGNGYFRLYRCERDLVR